MIELVATVTNRKTGKVLRTEYFSDWREADRWAFVYNSALIDRSDNGAKFYKTGGSVWFGCHADQRSGMDFYHIRAGRMLIEWSVS